MNIIFDKVFITKENPGQISMCIRIPTNKNITELLALKNLSDEQIATEIMQLLRDSVNALQEAE